MESPPLACCLRAEGFTRAGSSILHTFVKRDHERVRICTTSNGVRNEFNIHPITRWTPRPTKTRKQSAIESSWTQKKVKINVQIQKESTIMKNLPE